MAVMGVARRWLPHWPWAALLAVVLLTGAIRLGLAGVPLNRDEGEYAYVAQLMLEGTPPYARAYSMRLPGIYAVYAAILALFGQTHVGVHLGLAVVNGATVVLMFLLGRRLFDPVGGVVAAAAFGALSLGQGLLGFAAYTEHFVVLPAVGALLLLLRALDGRHALGVFAAGVLLGVATLIKQPGAFFVAFALAWLLRRPARKRVPLPRSVAALLAGVAVPVGLTVAALAAAGVWERFWFWTVRYASEYVTIRAPGQALAVLAETLGAILPAAWPFVVLAAVGLSALAWDAPARARAAFLGLFLTASLASTAVGLYFRPHYFILLLPAVALLAGAGAGAVARGIWLGGPGVPLTAVGLAALAVGQTVYLQHDFLFERDPRALARLGYHANPYPEAIEIARWLAQRTSPADRILVLGSEPEIYFYARRRAATGHVYMYGLMEDQPYARRMQEELIREVEAASPVYVVMVWVNYSWMARPDSEARLLDWFGRWRGSRYERVGVVDIVAFDRTEYRWEAEVAAYTPRSRYWLEILRRRTGT